MTKAQALGLVGALENAKVPCRVLLDFDAGGVEAWTVEIPDTFTVDSAHLAALLAYCDAHSLTVASTFSHLGIV